MDIKDVLNNVEDLTDYRLEQRLDEMIRKNPSFSHLNKENQELLLDLLKRYKDKVRKGIRVSGFTVRKDMYNLHSNRFKLNLTKIDLDKIRGILNSFKT